MQIEYRCKAISLIEGDAETPLSLEYKYVPVTVGSAGEVLMEGQTVSGCVAFAPDTLDTPVQIAPTESGGATTKTAAEMLQDAAFLIANAGLLATASAALDAAAQQP